MAKAMKSKASLCTCLSVDTCLAYGLRIGSGWSHAVLSMDAYMNDAITLPGGNTCLQTCVHSLLKSSSRDDSHLDMCIIGY